MKGGPTPHPRGRDGQGLCLQALGLQALAGLWLQGLRQVACLTGDCAACPDGTGLAADRAARLNGLLASRNAPGLLLHRAEVPPAGAVRIGPGAGADAGRRRFFAPGAPAARPLERLQQALPAEDALYAHGPRIDPALCTGCDACVRLCPAGALSLIKAGREGAAYTVDPARCSGCGVCSESCGEGAIRIEPISPANPPVALSDFSCDGCGVPVHVPAAGPWAEAALCPVCQRSPRRRPVRVLQ